MSIKVRSVDITVNFLYCGHCRDLKLVFSLARVRDSKSFSRTSVICSCRGFSCCPYYWGVRKARVDCILFHLWINTKTIKRDKFTKEQKLLEEICLQQARVFVRQLFNEKKRLICHSFNRSTEKTAVAQSSYPIPSGKKYRKIPKISPSMYKPRQI